uniref:Uncharacterized protein n=1 Tax=uncultured Verrucomicrobiales bacterium HF0200_39L05 TaxID=710997 RepID=E0XUN8_9BACT|nr:hypothetical protein [uncultured Verrucomicrobiales bacterium HF0200_39L05]
MRTKKYIDLFLKKGLTTNGLRVLSPAPHSREPSQTTGASLCCRVCY